MLLEAALLVEVAPAAFERADDVRPLGVQRQVRLEFVREEKPPVAVIVWAAGKDNRKIFKWRN